MSLFDKIAWEVYLESLKNNVFPISYSVARLLYMIAYLVSIRQKDVCVVEVGTGYGFSTLWLAKGLADANSNGIVYSFDVRSDRIEVAERYVRRAGLDKYVRFFKCNFLECLKDIQVEHIDLAFIDGRKDEYVAYLRALLPYLRKGSILIAHNVISPSPHKVSKFLELILNKPWVTIITQLDYGGVSISIMTHE